MPAASGANDVTGATDVTGEGAATGESGAIRASGAAGLKAKASGAVDPAVKPVGAAGRSRGRSKASAARSMSPGVGSGRRRTSSCSRLRSASSAASWERSAPESPATHPTAAPISTSASCGPRLVRRLPMSAPTAANTNLMRESTVASSELYHSGAPIEVWRRPRTMVTSRHPNEAAACSNPG